MEPIFFIAVGGALGALLRFWTGIAATAVFGTSFPLGTLAVNTAGSFVIGLTASAVSAGLIASAPWNGLIMQGFCGALTTFSTFSMDYFRLYREDCGRSAWTYFILSMVLCLGAAALGLSVFTQNAALPGQS
ncbi:MAG: fluoride efflux transporter CrcB [Mailhella sp.]|nr:fluoride efflux transporter CrcB [Mailhella sp.]